MNSDAGDLVNPLAERQVECIQLAMKRAGIGSEGIRYIGTHATGTDRGDATECDAVRTLFDEHSLAAITNTKSLIGHTMGAAGALEMAALLCAFHDGFVHPTINLETPDPRCDLRQIVTKAPRDVGSFQYGMVNSFGMLGINSSVIMRRPDLAITS